MVVNTAKLGSWAWPGPVSIYRWLTLAAMLLPFLHVFKLPEIAYPADIALIVCVSMLSAPYRTDMSTDEWRGFNRSRLWLLRAASLGAGYWLFTAAPGKTEAIFAVLFFAVLYLISENAVLRHKKVIEAH